MGREEGSGSEDEAEEHMRLQFMGAAPGKCGGKSVLAAAAAARDAEVRGWVGGWEGGRELPTLVPSRCMGEWEGAGRLGLAVCLGAQGLRWLASWVL